MLKTSHSNPKDENRAVGRLVALASSWIRYLMQYSRLEAVAVEIKRYDHLRHRQQSLITPGTHRKKTANITGELDLETVPLDLTGSVIMHYCVGRLDLREHGPGSRARVQHLK